MLPTLQSAIPALFLWLTIPSVPSVFSHSHAPMRVLPVGRAHAAFSHSHAPRRILPFACALSRSPICTRPAVFVPPHLLMPPLSISLPHVLASLAPPRISLSTLPSLCLCGFPLTSRPTVRLFSFVPSSRARHPMTPLVHSSLEPSSSSPSPRACRRMAPLFHSSLAPPFIPDLLPSPRARRRMTPLVPSSLAQSPSPLSSLPPSWPLPQGS
ncbi:unnamed protein product [Closterium sp. Naga37s-1]|nr:unnamed protein product [Closterium sp. Naga37s-1]